LPRGGGLRAGARSEQGERRRGNERRATMRVSPRKRANTALIGIAGVHHVVSELSRRGLVALATSRNTAAYDIVVTTPRGTRHANIQVKTAQKRVSFFRMPPSSKVMTGPHDFYVLLRWLRSQNCYEGFMLSGRAARTEVEKGEKFQRRRMAAGTRQGIVPSLYVGRKVEARAKRWRKTWLTWTLSRGESPSRYGS